MFVLTKILVENRQLYTARWQPDNSDIRITDGRITEVQLYMRCDSENCLTPDGIPGPRPPVPLHARIPCSSCCRTCYWTWQTGGPPSGLMDGSRLDQAPATRKVGRSDDQIWESNFRCTVREPIFGRSQYSASMSNVVLFQELNTNVWSNPTIKWLIYFSSYEFTKCTVCLRN